MELKHKECFCPLFIYDFDLQPVSKFARETWEFVNLYSKDRGINRFKGLIRVLDLLRERAEVQGRAAEVPRLEGLRSWIARENRQGNKTLKAALENGSASEEDLSRVYRWSLEVNDWVKRMAIGLPPFPYVRESLAKIEGRADAAVVSSSTLETLEMEWRGQELEGYVRLIAGQEMGSKRDHLAALASGNYEKEKCLVVGDAPGDLKAARAHGFLFYPIDPGEEEVSWRRFYEEAIDRFFSGTYAGEYEQRLIARFHRLLPETPPWS